MHRHAVSSTRVASGKYQAIELVDPGSGRPFFGFSRLCLCQFGGDFLKVCRCGQRMLKMCRNGGGWIIACRGPLWYVLPLMVLFTHTRQCSFRWVRREFQQQHEHNSKQWSECTSVFLEDAVPPPLYFQAAPSGWPLAMSASPDELWKRAIGGSGSDVLAQNPAIKDHSRYRSDFPCTPHGSGDRHLTPTVSKHSLPCNRPGQAGSCFVRLGIGLENCKLCSWKAVKNTKVFFLQQLCRFFFTSISAFFVLVR